MELTVAEVVMVVVVVVVVLLLPPPLLLVLVVMPLVTVVVAGSLIVWRLPCSLSQSSELLLPGPVNLAPCPGLGLKRFAVIA